MRLPSEPWATHHSEPGTESYTYEVIAEWVYYSDPSWTQKQKRPSPEILQSEKDRYSRVLELRKWFYIEPRTLKELCTSQGFLASRKRSSDRWRMCRRRFLSEKGPAIVRLVTIAEPFLMPYRTLFKHSHTQYALIHYAILLSPWQPNTVLKRGSVHHQKGFFYCHNTSL